MDALLPTNLRQALEMKAEHPRALPIAGGTDVMVDVNFGRVRPEAFIDVSRIPELRTWQRRDGALALGAGVPYARIVAELADFIPLVQASRSVGSPQIRTRGTVGGNLGTASPAGDALPVLAVYDAEIKLVSLRGARTLPWHDFLTGPKKTAIAPDELILEASWRVFRGAGSFSKIGTRNAMVIAVAGLALVIDEDARAIRVALGSVGPTILRATAAEAFIARAFTEAGAWDGPRAEVDPPVIREFGRLVAAAARPIDDVRGTAAYRRRALEILAQRALQWALDHRRTAAWW